VDARGTHGRVARTDQPRRAETLPATKLESIDELVPEFGVFLLDQGRKEIVAPVFQPPAQDKACDRGENQPPQ